MAETVVINIEANTQGLQTTIDLLTKLGVVEQKVADEFKKTNEQNVQSLNKGVQQTTKEFEKLDKAVKNVKADNQLAKSLDASKEITKTGNSFQSLRQQFKEATLEAQQLADKYGELDSRTLAAAKRAAELKDNIGDVNAQINALTPEGKFQAIQNFGGAIAGIFQVATGALQAFGVESETATKIAQQFQGALNIFGGLSQLSQAKDAFTALKGAFGAAEVKKAAQDISLFTNAINTIKDPVSSANASLSIYKNGLELSVKAKEKAKASADALKLATTGSTAATVVDTGAKEAQAIATVKAAEANAALNATARANPFIALTAALIAAAGVMNLIAENSAKAKIGVEELKNSTNELVKAKKALKESQEAELDADLRLQVAKKQITQAEAERIQLSRESLKLQVEDGVAIAKINIEIAKNREKLNVAEEELSKKRNSNAALRQRELGQEEQFLRTETTNVERLETTIANLEKTRAVLIEKKKTDNDTYTKLFVANKLEEQNAIKKTDIDADARFNKLIKLNTEYYQKLRDLAKINSKDQEEFNRLNTIVTAEELRKQASIYEKFSKDTTAVFAKIKENAEKDLIVKAPNINEFKNGVFEIDESIKGLKENGLAPISFKYRVIPETDKPTLEEATKTLKDELIKELGNLAITTGLEIAFDQINKAFEDSINLITELKDAQLEAITEEEEALNESYENRKIGKRELELEQERLTRQRVAAEKKAEKEIIEIKKKQDLGNRAAALFNIGLNTAEAITKANAMGMPTLIPFYIAIGALQAAAVLAQPLPKYKKGTLSVGGVGSEDSQLALLQPGEAVIPTETNKRYHPAIKAIYHGKIKPDDINNFVNLKLRGDYSSSEARPVMAKMDTSDLYALGRIMKKNDGVYVKNIGELAAMIADSYNPRR